MADRDVINYVRNSFGNKDEKGDGDDGNEVRKEFAGRTTPWTEAELQKFPEEVIRHRSRNCGYR